MTKKFYKVTTKCGHVGKNNFIYIDFPIRAESRKEASSIARWMPRAKHHDKYCIAACMEINEEEYSNLCKKNENDPYLKSKNKQQQRLIKHFENRIVRPERNDIKKHDMYLVLFKEKKYKERINALMP